MLRWWALASAAVRCGWRSATWPRWRINHGEYYALVLCSTAGMLLMVCAVDLLAVFLGLELMSIPIYVLAGFDRRKPGAATSRRSSTS